MSELENSARRRSVSGSKSALGGTRRSFRIWKRRSEGTVCNFADWPTSVLRILARLLPIQSRDGSFEVLRNGRIARERACAGEADDPEGRNVNFSRNTYTPPANSTTAPPTTSHF